MAQLLRVTTDSVAYWENNRAQPSLRMIPRITDFLGYNAHLEADAGESLGEWIVRVRRALDIRQKDLARQLGVDPGTLAKWERGIGQPSPAYRRRLSELFGASSRFQEPNEW